MFINFVCLGLFCFFLGGGGGCLFVSLFVLFFTELPRVDSLS